MQSFFENGVTVIDTGLKGPTRISNTGHHGIHELDGGRYQVCLSTQYIGIYYDLDEAVKIRKEAERQHEAGRLKEWVMEMRRNRKLLK